MAPAMDFPASPTDGQVYGNYVYSTSTGAWLSRGVTQTTAVTSDVPPSNPKAGDMWYNSTDGVMYLYYYDGNTYQWVQFKNDASFSSTLGPRVDAMESSGNTNYIINGAFDIWQRGTSFSTLNTYLADRWICYSNSSGSTNTFSRQSFSAGESLAVGAEYYFRYARTVAGTGETYNNFLQWVEGVQVLAGQTATISFWAKADAARSVNILAEQQFGTGGSGVTQTSFGTINLTTSWARYTVTGTVPSISGKTIGANNRLGVVLQLPFNSTFTIDLFGVQLQQGSLATAFHRHSPNLTSELAACQRYYWRYTPDGGYNRMAMGVGYNSTTVVMYVPNPVRMRVAPTSIESNLLAVWDGATLSGTATVVSFDSVGFIASTVFIAGLTGITISRPYQLLANGSTAAYLGMSAEL